MSYSGCIGFDIRKDGDNSKLWHAVENFARENNMIRRISGRGTFLYWQDENEKGFGPEIWLKLHNENGVSIEDGDNSNSMLYFRGKSRRRIGIVQHIPLEDYQIQGESTGNDGTYYGWSNPKTAACDSGDYPLKFEALGSQQEKKELPFIATFALTGFSQGMMEVYENEEAFLARPKVETDIFSTLGPESFSPDCLRSAEEKHAPPFAVLSGRVIETKVMRNTLDPVQDFTWALVETDGGLIDIVTYYLYLPKPLAVGDYIIGEFKLRADIISD